MAPRRAAHPRVPAFRSRRGPAHPRSRSDIIGRYGGVVLPRLLAEPRLGAVWVAESDGRLVGYLIAVLVLSVEHQGLMAEIDEFFVLPEARSCGVGRQLLAAAETALAARGCARLQLQLGVANLAGRGFYQHRGYAARAGYELLDKPLPVHG